MRAWGWVGNGAVLQLRRGLSACDMGRATLIAVAFMTIAGTAAVRAQSTDASASGSILLETITVSGDAGSGTVPTFEQQRERFRRRPGAETVADVKGAEAGRKSNLNDMLIQTPGIFLSERGAGLSGFVSMRGSDISIDGSRNGRGIRGYIDGIPLGRTDAGLTNTLIDPLATDFIEIYRGANSLRYGSIATGGALNIVSKTGLTAPGSSVTLSGGSFRNFGSQLETGGSKGTVDWYVQGNATGNDGFQRHTRDRNYRFSGNIGVQLAPNIENRTFFAVGSSRQDLAETLALDTLRWTRKTAPANSYLFDEDINLTYQRLANKTTIRDGATTYELGLYVLNTQLDHLPSPFAGIIDNGWRDYGASFRVEHKTSIAGLPTEFVAGARVNYTDADFERFQHRNAGRDKGRKIYDNRFTSWLAESYGEGSVELMPGFRAFAGLQAVFTDRDLGDRYRGGAVAALGPTVPGGPQPGRTAGLQQYDRDFGALNPKFGLNWEYSAGHFLFANIARSYEVPTGADLSDVLSLQSQTGRSVAPLRAQSAWTAEIGARGGWERFSYDVTLYHMRLRNEILTRCATEINASCSTTVAFNADRTIHNGIELGLKTKPFIDVFAPGDSIFANAVYNFSDFAFDGDPTYGDHRLPVIPRHQLFGEVGYRHPAGWFVSANLRALSDRRTTFDGSGGQAFVVPGYVLFGAKAGWTSADKAWTVFIEGRNLADRVYVSEFASTPTVPVVQQGRPGRYIARTSPQVRPGDGRAVYAGLTHRF